MNTVVVNADQGSQKISRHIYGHFMEHLGRCVYDGAWVGLDSTIPNTRGWRNDLIQMMRDIRVPNLRWPGGCFAEMYHWRDGIGPPADRPLTHVNETNAVGTHEFMDLCEIVGCVPYICGNLAGESVPAVSASASRDEGGVMHVSLCNLSLASDMTITCKLSGMSAAKVAGRILTHDDMTAHNTFDAPDVIAPTTFDGATLAGDELTVQLPAKSVVVLALT